MKQRRIASLVGLLVLTVGVGVYQTTYILFRMEVPLAGNLLMAWSMQLFLTFWIQADARCRRSWPCFDFGTFAFLAWPVAMPWYLIWSRGAYGILLSFVFFAIYFLPYFIAVIVDVFISIFDFSIAA